MSRPLVATLSTTACSPTRLSLSSKTHFFITFLPSTKPPSPPARSRLPLRQSPFSQQPITAAARPCACARSGPPVLRLNNFYTFVHHHHGAGLAADTSSAAASRAPTCIIKSIVAKADTSLCHLKPKQYNLILATDCNKSKYSFNNSSQATLASHHINVKILTRLCLPYRQILHSSLVTAPSFQPSTPRGQLQIHPSQSLSGDSKHVGGIPRSRLRHETACSQPPLVPRKGHHNLT